MCFWNGVQVDPLYDQWLTAIRYSLLNISLLVLVGALLYAVTIWKIMLNITGSSIIFCTLGLDLALEFKKLNISMSKNRNSYATARLLVFCTKIFCQFHVWHVFRGKGRWKLCAPGKFSRLSSAKKIDTKCKKLSCEPKNEEKIPNGNLK